MVAAAPVVALFDMDRTLIDTHTAKLYVRFQRDLGEIGAFETMRTTYWLLQYTFGVIDAKQVALHVSQGYRGKTDAWLTDRCQRWFQSHVRERISSIGRVRVREHLKAGHAVAIATSAVRQVAEPLARELSIPHLVCSELEVRDGELTGSFNWPLCYGAGKLERAKALVRSLDARLEQAAFYTDSITDLPLLEAVGHPIVVNPDTRLRRAAKRRGWLIEDWIATAAADRNLNRQDAKVAK
jgi:HAD superfamily hydrolase (TIGR01490 family)